MILSVLGGASMSAVQQRALVFPRITRRAIREFAHRIAERFPVQKIVLFGSHAYGRPTPDSDVDLLVVMPTRRREVDQAAEIRLAFDAPFPLDLLVRRPETVASRVSEGDCFLREITTRGVVLYESADERMASKGRGGLSSMPARVGRSARRKP
jgi:predicted nucleotidyltransferase